MSLFWPISLNFKEIADDERLGILTAVTSLSMRKKLWKLFSRAEVVELSEDREFIREFIGKIMKLDPRDRRTAKELL